MFFERESNVTRAKPWRRWREAMFATCTVWLVLQNVALLALVAWGHPASALAAGAAIAKTAISLSARLLLVVLTVALGFAFAAWLVHAPAETVGSGALRGARDGAPLDEPGPRARRASRGAGTVDDGREVSDVQ